MEKNDFQPFWPKRFLRQFPRLAYLVPRYAMGTYPTPVEKAEKLSSETGIGSIYVKRDDLSGVDYGGNKVRKLEFYIGQARYEGRKEILTIGPAGSNHTVATGWYARQAGIDVSAVSFPQPTGPYVAPNLLFNLSNRVRLYPALHPGTIFFTAARVWLQRLLAGRRCLYIPPGGSSPPGVLGYVLAAYELLEQIETGAMPRPTRIYVPCGSAGTAAGLMLGFRLAGADDIRVVAVPVLPAPWSGGWWVVRHANRCARWMRSIDPHMPMTRFTAKDLDTLTDQVGPGYAISTPQSSQAMEIARESEGLALDVSYTAKTLAGLIDHEKSVGGGLNGDVILFWNTVNSRDFSDKIEKIDPSGLPKPLKRHFNSGTSTDPKSMKLKGPSPHYPLQVPSAAPDFSYTDRDGSQRSLYDWRGQRHVVLIFNRYKGCPICQMNMADLKRHHEAFGNRKTEVIILLETAEGELREWTDAKGWPFALVSDPEKRIFAKYGLGRGGLKEFLAPSAAIKSVKATLGGHFHGKFNGDEFQLPANFIIDSESQVRLAHYGKDIGDHLSARSLLDALDALQSTTNR